MPNLVEVGVDVDQVVAVDRVRMLEADHAARLLLVLQQVVGQETLGIQDGTP